MKFSQKIYWQIVQSNYIYTDTNYITWANELKIDPDSLKEDWPEILIMGRKISNAAKLRHMQYKILNKILVTNLSHHYAIHVSLKMKQFST